MGIKRKQTHDDELRIQCYQELLKETGDVPSIAEVDQRFREKYGK
jgi:hypothetical protein